MALNRSSSPRGITTARRPQLPDDDLFNIIEANKVPHDFDIVAIAIRGYLLNSMGKTGQNDRRCYDDAHFIVDRRNGRILYRTFGNTDPNGYREGRGTGSNKGMASLATGIHLYTPGIHKTYEAFRQAERFTVYRDGPQGPYADRRDQDFGINWHPGGGWINTWGQTWSEGCQTNPKKLFLELRDLTYEVLFQSHNPRGQALRPWTHRPKETPLLPYILLEETKRREGNLIVSSRYS